MSFHIKIGNYRFSKNLGTGSFGKVKLAFNEVTGHKVAIKILNKKKIKQQGVFEKVKREIKVLRLFNHPHIIKHYEFIDTPSDIFMVIEYASGGELFELISRRERLEEEEARRFFQQIFSSVEYTHAHKISHRDLKPENLLLDSNNNIKLIDFGLANSMKDSQALRTACGSPNYAAPEVISGRPYSGVEVDVWSMGIILYAMMCGSLPFDDDSMTQLFNKIKEGKYVMPNYISVEVKDLINRMLQPNPVKRITMREIKEHPWYLKDLPLYLTELSQQHQQKAPVEADPEILRKMTNDYNQFMQGKSQEEIEKLIREKKNNEICGIYELMYHDKLKKDCFNEMKENEKHMHQKFNSFKTLLKIQENGQVAQQSTPAGQLILNKQQSSQKSKPQLLSEKHHDRLKRIQQKIRYGQIFAKKRNQLSNQSNQSAQSRVLSVSTQIDSAVVVQQNKNMQNFNSDPFTRENENLFHPQFSIHQVWQFGVLFIGSPTDMLNLTCEIFKKLDIEWQLIPKDLRMKCRSRIDENTLGDDLIRDGNVKDEVIKEFLRKNFIKFYINIYKDQSNKGQQSNQEDKYNMDIHLFKGTVCVFMDFAKRMLEILKASCLCVSRGSTNRNYMETSPSLAKQSSIHLEPSPLELKCDQNPLFCGNIKIII